MWWLVVPVLFFGTVQNLLENDFMGDNKITIEHYVYWPNATVPFYIDPYHFDHEQSNTILVALANFAFKTCLKFLPALVRPTGDQHVLLLQNPDGVRKCVMSTTGHARDEPHKVVLGYDCLQPPKIDMMLMRALGFGFEHNRAVRDLYVTVLKENIDPSAIDLFTMDDKLPLELRALPYDVNSVLHFDEREFSKNGHRTIVILDHKIKQSRNSLTDLDVRKIDVVYGPECRKRDRQEKIDLCQGFPGVARRKRSLDQLVRRKRDVVPPESQSLRVNPDITPPPELVNNSTKDVDTIIEALGIKDGVEEITDLVFKVGALALNNTRKKYCNNTDNITVVTKGLARRSDDKKHDILGIVENVADFLKDMVDHALSNITAFCESESDFRAYQRARCPYYNSGGGGGTCWGNYRSTKNGPVMYSTQNKPWIVQSTKHAGGSGKRILYSDRRNYGESGRKTQLKTESERRDVRKKRDTNIQDANKEKEAQRRFEGRRYNVRTKERRWDDSDLSAERHKRKREREREDEQGIKSYERDDGPREDRSKERRHEKKDAELKRSKGNVPRTVELSKKNKEFYGERMWPYGVVRYIVNKDETFDLADLRRRLDAVNRILKERTCVKLEEITEEDAERFEDYLVLDASADYITGRVGGRQNFGSLELFEGGQHKQHAAMMVMAMLGFYFEVARHDRDSHVRVHMRHVRADKLHHFEKIRSDATLPLPYDYDSATHPAWQFWRKLGRIGISTVATYKEKDPDGSIMRSLGQHDRLLSESDIVKINSVYGVKCFTEPEQDEEKAEQDFEEDIERDKYNDKHRDRDTENRDLEKHHNKGNQDNHRITLDRDEDRHKIRDDGRNEGRHRDRHRNKHKQESETDIDDRKGRDDRDRNEGNRHRRPHHESEEDREEMERLGDKGRGNKKDVDRQSKERFKNMGKRLPKNERDWDMQEKYVNDYDKDTDYIDKYEEIRPGVVSKHGGMKGRHKNRDETEMEEEKSGRPGRGDYGRNKYKDDRQRMRDPVVPNRYQIKDREERDRDRHRGRDRDRQETEDENRGRGRGRHRNRRERNREERETDRDRRWHGDQDRPGDQDRRESGIYTGRPVGREGPNAGHTIARELKRISGGRPISKERQDGQDGHSGGDPISKDKQDGYKGPITKERQDGHNGGRPISKEKQAGYTGGHLVASEVQGTEIKWRAGDQVPWPVGMPTVPRNKVRRRFHID